MDDKSNISVHTSTVAVIPESDTVKIASLTTLAPSSVNLLCDSAKDLGKGNALTASGKSQLPAPILALVPAHQGPLQPYLPRHQPIQTAIQASTHPQIPNSLTQSKRRSKSISRASLAPSLSSENTDRSVPSNKSFPRYSLPATTYPQDEIDKRDSYPRSLRTRRAEPSLASSHSSYHSHYGDERKVNLVSASQNGSNESRHQLKSTNRCEMILIPASQGDTYSQTMSDAPKSNQSDVTNIPLPPSNKCTPPRSQTSSTNPPSNSSSPRNSKLPFKNMLNDMEKELTCSICTSVFLHPVVLLDCLHAYCGACAKEWFVPPTPATLSSPIIRGCPTCRQPVRGIKPSPQLNNMVTIFLRSNPQSRRDHQEIIELEKIYQPGNEILVGYDVFIGDKRDRFSRRAGDGWWDGMMDEMDLEQNALEAAVRASLRDLRGHEHVRNSSFDLEFPSFRLASPRGRQSWRPESNIARRSTNHSIYGPSVAAGSPLDTFTTNIESLSLTPARLSIPSPPSSPPAQVQEQTEEQHQQPDVNCDACGKKGIQFELHYHCPCCRANDFDLCAHCVRQGKHCLNPSDRNHQLQARKFQQHSRGVEKGRFCNVEDCENNCNELFWHCKTCNDGWDYCPSCVGKGNCCTHDLEGMSCSPFVIAELGINRGSDRTTQLSDIPDQVNATGMVADLDGGANDSVEPAIQPKAESLKLNTRCNLCFEPITLLSPHYHCIECNGGDWDCHISCIPSSIDHSTSSTFVSPICNHSKQVVVQVAVPNEEAATAYLRRILEPAYKPLSARSYTYRTSQGSTVTVEPQGGINDKGQEALAKWAYWPERTRPDAKDELGFPKGAIICDVLEINREWMWGCLGTQQGLFPSGWVTLSRPNEQQQQQQLQQQ